MKIEEEVGERWQIAFRDQLANAGVIRRGNRQQRFEGDDPRLIDFGATHSFVSVAEMKANVTDKRSIIAGGARLQ